jgi:hypothetical protein
MGADQAGAAQAVVGTEVDRLVLGFPARRMKPSVSRSTAWLFTTRKRNPTSSSPPSTSRQYSALTRYKRDVGV